MIDAGTPFGEPRRDALGERLDVFRGCGDHVYQNADCPHCTNNSAVVDKILQHLARQRQEQELAWQAMAEQESRNRDYYRSLVVEIGEVFGIAARTADDGGVHEDVLCAKVPELVRAQAAAQGDLVARLGKALTHLALAAQSLDDLVAAQPAIDLMVTMPPPFFNLMANLIEARDKARAVLADLPPSRTP